MTPNPFIERTHKSGLRQFLDAAHVKRLPPQRSDVADFLLKDSKSKADFKSWLESALVAYGASADLKWSDEDTLCEHFFSSISGHLKTPTGELRVSSYKTRGRGPGAPEKKLGADGICLVNVATPHADLNGFFLFQAKKAERLTDHLRQSSNECAKMLKHSAASYLLVLMRREAHMAGAMAVHSHKSSDPPLHAIPYVSFPRFAVEHLLHGIMLEPLNSAASLLSPDLREEIKHVVTIVGASADAMAEAQKVAEMELDRLGLSDAQDGGG